MTKPATKPRRSPQRDFDEQDLEEFREALAKHEAEIGGSKEKAQAFLKKVGYLTPTGRIAKMYR